MSIVLSDPSFVVRSEAMRYAIQQAELFARANVAILFIGATGTGKSHMARLVHAMSGRKGPLAEMTVAESSSELVRDTLFGHERGAFTGALQRRIGLLAEAAAGTLFLDDFHNMAVAEQAMLLRALQNRAYRPLGADRDVLIRCRLIVAVREHPDQLVASELLLPDLRFRLGFSEVELPALAERREEIEPLAALFLAACPAETGVAGPSRFAGDVLPALEAAPWTGNVRELREVITTAYLRAQHDQELAFHHLPKRAQVAPVFQSCGDEATNLRAVAWALWRTGGRVDEAARLIGAHRNTVARIAALHNLQGRIVRERQSRRRRGFTTDGANDSAAQG